MNADTTPALNKPEDIDHRGNIIENSSEKAPEKKDDKKIDNESGANIDNTKMTVKARKLTRSKTKTNLKPQAYPISLKNWI